MLSYHPHSPVHYLKSLCPRAFGSAAGRTEMSCNCAVSILTHSRHPIPHPFTEIFGGELTGKGISYPPITPQRIKPS